MPTQQPDKHERSWQRKILKSIRLIEIFLYKLMKINNMEYSPHNSQKKLMQNMGIEPVSLPTRKTMKARREWTHGYPGAQSIINFQYVKTHPKLTYRDRHWNGGKRPIICSLRCCEEWDYCKKRQSLKTCCKRPKSNSWRMDLKEDSRKQLQEQESKSDYSARRPPLSQPQYQPEQSTWKQKSRVTHCSLKNICSICSIDVHKELCTYIQRRGQQSGWEDQCEATCCRPPRRLRGCLKFTKRQPAL